ncbi:MAG: Gfo/Idh/MocA family oxidoreductase [Bacteroidota bacterium]
MHTVNWGILGTGKIATKFAEDLPTVENAKLVAVGSRSSKSAQEFAQKFGADRAHPTYLDLVKDPEVDIIYVSTPHSFHKENTILCLNHGKAVLCEKPIGVNRLELEEMINIAQQRKLFMMEAMWTYFLPTINKTKEWIANGSIGEIQHIKADFGFKAPYDPAKRLFNPELAGGALLDVGIYPLAFSLLFAQSDVSNLSASSTKSSTGVDLTNTYQLYFENGVTADLSCSLGHRFDNDGIIYGTEGYIKLPLFWKSTDAFLYKYNSTEVKSFTDERETNGYNFEAQEATNLLLQGKTESSIMPKSVSLNLLEHMDNIRREIGLIYPFEKSK